MSLRLFTSESVSEGHPAKIADQISDAVLDAIIAEDPKARVACETLIKTGVVVLAGEITTAAWVDFDQIVRVKSAAQDLITFPGRKNMLADRLRADEVEEI